MKTRVVATMAMSVLLIAACGGGSSSAEIQANQKSIVSTLGRDIATYYVDFDEPLTLSREGNVITLMTESGSPLTAYELSGAGVDFTFGSVQYRVAGDPAMEWCIDVGYGDGPSFSYSAREGLSEGTC